MINNEKTMLMFMEFIQSKEGRMMKSFIYYPALITAIAGGCLYLFDQSAWRLVLSIAGFIYIIHQLIRAYDPLHEELDWTLVYPELAGMSHGDEKEEEAGKEAMQLKLDYYTRQLDLAKDYLEKLEKPKH